MNNNKPADLGQQQQADFIQQEWERLQNEAIAAQRWRLEHEKSQSVAKMEMDDSADSASRSARGHDGGFQLTERWSLRVIFGVLMFITVGYGLLMWLWL